MIDTGAFANAVPQNLIDELKEERTVEILYSKPEYSTVKLASGAPLPINSQAEIKFKIGHLEFTENFLVLPTMNSIILGNPFFRKHSIEISPTENLLKFPDLTFQLNEIKSLNNNRSFVKPSCSYNLKTMQKRTLKPNEQKVIACSLPQDAPCLNGCSGTVTPDEKYESDSELIFCSSLSKVGENNEIYVIAINPTEHLITIPRNTLVAQFKILTPKETEYVTPVTPELISLAKMRNPDNFMSELNQLIIDSTFEHDRQPPRPPPNYSKFWFPTPESCDDPSKLSGVHLEIYNQLQDLLKLDASDPKSNDEDRAKFLSNFDWSTSVLTPSEKLELEKLLVEFSDIFAKHRFDVGYNTEIKIKLTPSHNLPVYVQSPPTPIHLRDELLVELALMQYYNLITTLPQSRYSSPIFVQRKKSGCLRILIDLRRINHLLKEDYMNSNFPISNMQDATNHFVGKKLFTKLDCSQAYHCVQVADEISSQLLAFNFASRTYAYLRLPFGLNKSVTGFSSFVRNYLDNCLSANLCTQFMDDIGTGAKDFPEMLHNLREIFKSLRRSGLRLAPSKCEFGAKSISFLGNVITEEGIKPEKKKIEEFLSKVRLPTTVKQVKRLIGFLQFFKAYLPNLGTKLIPFYKLLRKDIPFELLDEHRLAFKTLCEDLQRATELTLRLAKANAQFVLLCDASYHGAGFVLMVETSDDNRSKRKNYAPVSFGSRVFNTAQLKLSIYCKEFLALYFALEHFAHFLWGAEKPVIVLTDNRSLVQFFQSKTIPPSLWNFLDRVLAFNLLLAHIPGRANAAADFLSRTQTDPSAVLELKLSDRIPIKEMDVTLKAKTPNVELSTIEHFDKVFLDVNFDSKVIENLQKQGVYEQVLQAMSATHTDTQFPEVHGFVKLTQTSELYRFDERCF